MRRSVLVALCVGCACQLFSVSAEARYYYRRGYGYGGGYGGATTPQSAAGNAMANIIRSQGMYNVMTSQAMVNVEQARGAYIANQQSAMQFYYARKRATQAERNLELEQEKDKIQRYMQYVAQKPTGPRLDGNQLNPITGRITWPRALQEAAFSDQRNAAESYFSDRAKQTPTVADSKKIHDTIMSMRDELRGKIHDLNSTDYMESRKFLDNLAAEVDHPKS